uniref:(California timema) hypothetical protein n=1 Tax=Timema californicum TaxID=61474 RepID=A0A7R9IZ87_TIMCA|nr:unnamed protein product [Timema californicum]
MLSYLVQESPTEINSSLVSHQESFSIVVEPLLSSILYDQSAVVITIEPFAKLDDPIHNIVLHGNGIASVTNISHIWWFHYSIITTMHRGPSSWVVSQGVFRKVLTTNPPLDSGQAEVGVILVGELGVAETSLGTKVEPFFCEKSCLELVVPAILKVSLRVENLTWETGDWGIVELTSTVSMQNLPQQPQTIHILHTFQGVVSSCTHHIAVISQEEYLVPRAVAVQLHMSSPKLPIFIMCGQVMLQGQYVQAPLVGDIEDPVGRHCQGGDGIVVWGSVVRQKTSTGAQGSPSWGGGQGAVAVAVTALHSDNMT